VTQPSAQRSESASVVAVNAPRNRCSSNMLSSSQSQLGRSTQNSAANTSRQNSTALNGGASTSSQKMAELLKPVRKTGASRQGSTAMPTTSASSQALSSTNDRATSI
jgi:hypothetical protein